MKTTHLKGALYASAAALALGVFGQTGVASAAPTSQQDLLQRVQTLERALQEVKAELAKSRQQSKTTEKIAKRAARTAATARKQASAPDNAVTKWHLAGYANVGFEAINKGKTDSFTSGKFNPVFHFQYKNLVVFESELEIETGSDGETTTDLEYAQADIFLTDNITFVFGKYLSPIGQFQERLHPSWINKSISMPAGFGHDGVQPGSDVGVQLRGGVPVGGMVFTYALAAGNGPRLGAEGPELEGFPRDNNSNKSLGGRLGFLPLPYLEFGASYLTAKVNTTADAPAVHGAALDSGASDLANYKLWGVDMAFTKGSWDVRFEYLDSKLTGLGAGGGLSGLSADGAEEGLLETNGWWKAWYTQAAYRLAGITDQKILRNFEPVVRYGKFLPRGNDELEEGREERFNVGLNYWFTPTAVLKSNLEIRNFQIVDIPDETRFQFQFAYGF